MRHTIHGLQLERTSSLLRNFGFSFPADGWTILADELISILQALVTPKSGETLTTLSLAEPPSDEVVSELRG